LLHTLPSPGIFIRATEPEVSGIAFIRATALAIGVTFPADEGGA
jgi:hypothetical protein